MGQRWRGAAEADVVSAAASGDAEAFAELYDRHAPWVYSRFLCEFGGPAEAQDATQDTFVEVWRSLSQLRDPAAFRAWVVTIANRRAMRSKGDRALQLDPSSLESTTRYQDPSPGPEQQAELNEARQLVSAALASLHPRYRTAVEFLLAHGHAGRDLGAVLGVSPAQASRVADKATRSLADAARALVVARTGRNDCDGLDRVLTEAGWTAGPLTEDLRTAVQRHISRCDRCRPRRHAAARIVIESLPVAFPLLVPATLRDRTLGTVAQAASLQPAPSFPGPGPGPGARPPGAPRPGGPRPGTVAAAVGAVLLALGAVVVTTDDGPQVLDSGVPTTLPAGDGATDDDSASTTTTDSTDPTDGDDDLAAIDQGFSVMERDGALHGSYGFVVENTSDAPIEKVTYSVEFHDEDGYTLSGVAGDTLFTNFGLIRPGQRVVVGHDFWVPVTDLVISDFAEMEVFVSPSYESPETATPPDGEIVASDVATSATSDGNITTTFTAKSTFGIDLIQPIAFVIYRNAAGDIIGGGTAIAVPGVLEETFLPAGGTRTMSVTTPYAVEDLDDIDTTEVSVDPGYDAFD